MSLKTPISHYVKKKFKGYEMRIIITNLRLKNNNTIHA